MADSDFPGFAYNPRASGYQYSSRISWPTPAYQNDSPQGRNLGANASANAVKRSTTPLQNQGANLQPMNQHCQLRPHSQGHEQAYSRLIGQQNAIPSQIHSQTPLRFDQQPGPQHQTFASHYRNQNQAYNPSMNLPQASQSDDQSNPSDWSYQAQPSTSQPYPLNTSYAQQFNNTTNNGYVQYGSSPVNFMPQNPQWGNNVPPLDHSYLPLNSDYDWTDLSTNLMNFPTGQGLPDMSMVNQALPNSPTDTSLEVRSLSSSDNGWASVEYPRGFDGSYADNQAIFNPGQTLHNRTFSDSSFSDVENHARLSWSSGHPEVPHAIGSPSSDSYGDHDFHHDIPDLHEEVPIKLETQPSPVFSSSTTAPIKIKLSKSPQRSPTASRKTSPPGRRPPRKNSIKATKAAIKKQTLAVKGDTEKRIGRRKGPLRPEQRKQASEIRKLGACLRCKFLKKTVSLYAIFAWTVAYKRTSATKANLVRDACPPTHVSGRCHVPESISKRSPTSCGIGRQTMNAMLV